MSVSCQLSHPELSAISGNMCSSHIRQKKKLDLIITENMDGSPEEGTPIREIPDHATLRGKGANTAWLDKLGLFPSLGLCN